MSFSQIDSCLRFFVRSGLLNYLFLMANLHIFDLECFRKLQWVNLPAASLVVKSSVKYVQRKPAIRSSS